MVSQSALFRPTASRRCWAAVPLLPALLAAALSQAGARPFLPQQEAAPKVNKQAATTALLSSGAQQLLYSLKPGEEHHYKVTAMFDGRFPPFAQPGSPPIHMLVQLHYLARVVKQSAEGAQADFTVESADLSLLDSETPLDAKIDADKSTPFPIDLAEVQNALNSSVLLRPDGSIVKLLSKNPNLVKVNIGFQLEKMFLLLMPVTFPANPVAVGSDWPSASGVLGSKAGSIRYTNHLTGKSQQGAHTFLKFAQEGVSTVDDTLDKGGVSTDKPADVESRLSGNVTFKGDLKYQAQRLKAGAAGTSPFELHLDTGLYTMDVHLARKVTREGMKPEQKAFIEGQIDVKARMLVRSADQVAQK